MEKELYLILIMPGVIILLFLFSIWQLYSKSKKVSKNKILLNAKLSERFSIFENLIAVIRTKTEYESTILKDIVQLRSQAQAFKNLNEQQNQWYAEDKISLIIKKIDIFLEQYKSDDEIIEIKERIRLCEKQLKRYKENYNLSLTDFLDNKNSFIGQIAYIFIKNNSNKNFIMWN